MLHIPAYRYYATLLGIIGAMLAIGAWYSRTVRVFALDEFAGTEHDVVVEAASAWAPVETGAVIVGAALLLSAVLLGLIGSARSSRRNGHVPAPSTP